MEPIRPIESRLPDIAPVEPPPRSGRLVRRERREQSGRERPAGGHGPADQRDDEGAGELEGDGPHIDVTA